MNFVSGLFLAFLIILFTVHVLLPAKWRRPVLLGASYLFYATWSIPFIGIIFLTTSLDYYFSHVIHNSKTQGKRKAALITGLGINLLILGFFKYCNFFLSTSHGLAHWFGYQLALPTALQIILPLGISFYTFEAISYMVDVYRGKSPAPRWLDYNFYIMFFPHLISGPIVRFEELWEQYRQPLQLPSMQRLQQAFELIILGFLFKIGIADTASTLADPVFTHPATGSILATYLGVLGFTVQIYFDFMGYTHIARGVSLLFNIELPLNFNHPYVATNISNFWERWHISLSRWIRDYLFIPVGGSRGSLPKTAFNLVLVMFIAGAWHGAGWTFIVWGGYHGVLLALYHIFKTLRKTVFGNSLKAILDNPLYNLASIIVTFISVMVGWVIFRAPNFATVMVVLQRLTNFKQLLKNLGHAHGTQIPMLVFLLAFCFAGPWVIELVASWYRPMPFWLKAQVACIVALFCWVLTSESFVPFIYFQF